MTEEEEIIIVPGRWDLPFRHTAGRIASHFFHGLKEKRILATRCPHPHSRNQLSIASVYPHTVYNWK